MVFWCYGTWCAFSKNFVFDTIFEIYKIETLNIIPKFKIRYTIHILYKINKYRDQYSTELILMEMPFLRN